MVLNVERLSSGAKMDALVKMRSGISRGRVLRRRRWRAVAGICLANACFMTVRSAPLTESAASCAGIVDNMERLACYDAIFKKPPLEQTRPAVPASAPAAVPPTSAAAPESKFGDDFRNHRNNGPSRMSATVQSVTPLGRGLYRLTLDNGQVWDTTQTDSALEFHASNNITISRMMLGNYLISRTGQGRSVAVKRVQ
jgi:hypothetical protein